MLFEWYEQKRLENLGKHGIDFFDAKEIWQGHGPFVEVTDKSLIKRGDICAVGGFHSCIVVQVDSRNKTFCTRDGGWSHPGGKRCAVSWRFLPGHAHFNNDDWKLIRLE